MNIFWEREIHVYITVHTHALGAASRRTHVICHKGFLWATALVNPEGFPCLHKTIVLLRERMAPVAFPASLSGRTWAERCLWYVGWKLVPPEPSWETMYYPLWPEIRSEAQEKSCPLQGSTKKKERTGLQWLCFYAEFIFLQCWVLSRSSILTSPQPCSCADVQAVLHEQGRDTFLISCSDISTLWHLYLLQQTITVHIANQYSECEGVRSTQSLVHYCTTQLFTVQ